MTERKRAEDALRQSEMYLAEAQRISHTGSFGWRVATGEIIWSEETFRIFEFDRTTRPTAELVLQRSHPEDRSLIGQLIERVSREGRDWDIEHRLLMPDGSIKYLHVVAHAVKDVSGNLEFVGAVMDITDRKRAEYLIAQVFERSPDGVSIIGRDYRFQQVNPTYERNWKRPADRIVGKHIADFLGMQVFERTVKPNLDRCFEGEEIRYAEWFVNEIGRRFLSLSYSPLRPNSERVEAALAITRDLTEHMLAAESVREAQAKLAHANRVMLLGEMVASIAHEVNQPISAAVTNASAGLRWLAMQPPDMEEVRRALERIVRDGMRASDVIARIRALVKKAPPRKDSLDVNGTIREVIVLTSGELSRNNIKLLTRLSSDLPVVSADRVQLQQVILNLFANAIEAMSGASDRPRELVVSSGAGDSNDIFVEVRDSGPGLDPDNSDRVFQSFYTTKPGGMGMGLALCRSIVTTHGGRLWAMPNDPPGAVFRFTLPITAGSSTEPRSLASHHPLSPKSLQNWRRQ